MFDLFKKEEINTLKSRIAELEDENRKLLSRLEKKDEKTKKAASTKQEVDRELNGARQRLLSLENELQKLKKETPSGLSYRFSDILSKKKLDDVLYLLGSMRSRASTLITIYLTQDETVENVAKDLAGQIDSSSLYLMDKIGSSTGKAVFYDTDKVIRLVIVPNLPIKHPESAIDRQFNIEPLENTFESGTTMVLNAHAGETFVGIMEADTFVEHEVIRSSVMGKHSKGGWSQKRFQSLVEEDVRHHADKVRESLIPMIGKHKDIEYVVAGGEGKLMRMILEGYDYPLVIKSMDSIGKGNVDQVLREVMAVRWYGI